MKKMGRPKGKNNKECICTIRLDVNTLNRLETYCKLMNKPKSKVIREAITALIDNSNAK